MKGQGSTEYLVIFAAVLVVALIVIFLLGQFTGFGRESLVDQSKGYWTGKKPIAITDWSIQHGTTSSATFLVKNNDVEKIELVNITTNEGVFSSGAGNITSGSTTTITGTTTAQVCANAGDIAELTDVVIYYKKPSVSTSTVFAEAGTMPIRVQCN